jgi:hypothetical protein
MELSELKCYSRRLESGESELTPVFFNLDILESYINDPRYEVHFDDYSGRLSGGTTNEDYIYIQTIGLAYSEEKKRLLVVFLCYLSEMSAQDQVHWNRYENKANAKIAKPYYDNVIAGEWEFPMSFYSAILHEQLFINTLSEIIFSHTLFRETFEDERRPIEFNYLQMPTAKNYGSTIAILDGMLGQNINGKFLSDIFRKKNLTKIENQGSIRQLIQIVSTYYKVSSGPPVSEIFQVWLDVRNERNSNSNAHKPSLGRVYDEQIGHKRDEVVGRVYDSLKELRQIFQDHPKCRHVDLPERLKERVIIV